MSEYTGFAIAFGIILAILIPLWVQERQLKRNRDYFYKHTLPCLRDMGLK